MFSICSSKKVNKRKKFSKSFNNIDPWQTNSTDHIDSNGSNRFCESVVFLVDIVEEVITDFITSKNNLVSDLEGIINTGTDPKKTISIIQNYLNDFSNNPNNDKPIISANKKLTQNKKFHKKSLKFVEIKNCLSENLNQLAKKFSGFTSRRVMRRLSDKRVDFKSNRSNDGISYRHLITNIKKEDGLTVKRIGSYFSQTDETTFQTLSALQNNTLSQTELLSFLRLQIQGRYNIIKTPFGGKLKLYADYTASGQTLQIVELFFNHVLEHYANTHTEASHNGKFMNTLFHEAELKILESCKADKTEYSVLPTGTGATGAIEIVQKILGTYLPPRTKKTIGGYISFDKIKKKLRDKKELPLIIISPYEHHSNEVTWRYQLCDIETVPLTKKGYMDLKQLDKILKKSQKNYKRLIGSFSAGSNVTGIKTEIKEVVRIMKKYNGLVFFDYAGTGPYVDIDMAIGIDGLYLSPHKFLGGPGSSGIAVIKNTIYDTTLEPTHGGGGTVDFVNKDTAVFTKNIMSREKSGTPGILQVIKAGLVINLKTDLYGVLHKREMTLMARFFKRFVKDDRVFILGPLDYKKRVPIVSFNIKHKGPRGVRLLNPVFVIRLLSDLFGIQGRAGCSCAGPYGHRLLEVSDEDSSTLRDWITAEDNDINKEKFEGLKLGWARINLHYTFTDRELDYIIAALDFVAEHGYVFLQCYEFDPKSAVWSHVNERGIEKKLLDFDLLREPVEYAKDEEAREIIFKWQIKEAVAKLEELDKRFELDCLDSWKGLAYFYVAKGNLRFKEELRKKDDFLKLKTIDTAA